MLKTNTVLYVQVTNIYHTNKQNFSQTWSMKKSMKTSAHCLISTALTGFYNRARGALSVQGLHAFIAVPGTLQLYSTLFAASSRVYMRLQQCQGPFNCITVSSRVYMRLQQCQGPFNCIVHFLQHHLEFTCVYSSARDSSTAYSVSDLS